MKKISTLVGIIIIIVVAIIAFGGVFAYQYFSKSQTPITKSQTNSNVQTADWKTYTSGEYGFSFNYPADWSLQTTAAGVSVLTKQHEAYNVGSLNGSNIDFSVSACKLSDKECLATKQDLDKTFSSYSSAQNTALLVDGVSGHQWVEGSDQYAYIGVIESNGILYQFNSTVDEYTTRYPDAMSDLQVKAIFDSFKFITPTNQTASYQYLPFPANSGYVAFKDITGTGINVVNSGSVPAPSQQFNNVSIFTQSGVTLHAGHTYAVTVVGLAKNQNYYFYVGGGPVSGGIGTITLSNTISGSNNSLVWTVPLSSIDSNYQSGENYEMSFMYGKALGINSSLFSIIGIKK
jgi:hypothetical protein